MADKYFKIPRHSGGPGFISRQSPVNRAHGINNSLVFWLCPLVTGASVLDIAHNIKCTATGDASLNGYTPHGMPAFTFGGSSDNISVPAEMLGRLTNSEATVSMWIKPSSWPGPYTEMFGGRTNASNSERQLNFYGINDTSGHVAIATTSGAGSGQGYTAGTWSHFCMVVDNDGALFYKDGVFQSSTFISTVVGSGFGAAVWYIGDDGTSDLDDYVGSITDVKVWDRPLSAQEVMYDHVESLRLYPNSINRTPVTYFIPAASGFSTWNTVVKANIATINTV